MNLQNNRTRVIVLLVAVLVLGAVGTGAVLYAADRTARRDQPQSGGPAVTPGNVSLQAPSAGRQLLFRNMAWGPHRDEITTVPADHPDGPRTASGTQCLRFHAAAGTGICLQAEHGALEDTYRAVVLDDHLHQRRSFPAAGIPTRARVSPSGHLAAWTVFVSGDSYAGTNFSTRTSIVDVRDWNLRENLEDFAVIKDGRPYQAHDVNIWGVTFADDNTFYATLATSGQTHLVRGDLAAPSPPCTTTSNAPPSPRTAPASPTRSASPACPPTPPGGCTCSTSRPGRRPPPTSSATSTTRRSGPTTAPCSTPCQGTTAPTCGPSRRTAPAPRGWSPRLPSPPPTWAEELSATVPRRAECDAPAEGSGRAS